MNICRHDSLWTSTKWVVLWPVIEIKAGPHLLLVCGRQYGKGVHWCRSQHLGIPAHLSGIAGWSAPGPNPPQRKPVAYEPKLRLICRGGSPQNRLFLLFSPTYNFANASVDWLAECRNVGLTAHKWWLWKSPDEEFEMHACFKMATKTSIALHHNNNIQQASTSQCGINLQITLVTFFRGGGGGFTQHAATQEGVNYCYCTHSGGCFFLKKKKKKWCVNTGQNSSILA